MATFPVRCFTCGKVIVWQPYSDLLKAGKTPDEALDKLKMSRMCCRRMFLGHVPELEEQLTWYPVRDQKQRRKIKTEEDSD